MDASFDHEMIMVVANRGFSQDVMDAARSANATGGTVIHARRAGIKEAETFFGVAIQPEKELILIAAKREHRSAIMEAIIAKAGYHTDAKAAVVSLPISAIVGMAEAAE